MAGPGHSNHRARHQALCKQYEAHRTRELNKARRMGMKINDYLTLREKNLLGSYQQDEALRGKTRAQIKSERMGISVASYTQLRNRGLLGDWNRYDLSALNEGVYKVLPKYLPK